MGDRNPLQRYPVASFYILAFAISWLGWVPQALFSRGMFPLDTPLFALLGGGGPTFAAIIVTLALREIREDDLLTP